MNNKNHITTHSSGCYRKMKTIKITLFCGAIYFLLMAIAHAIGLKIPGLFIYFNVPSYAYQDKIISLLTFGWSIFFFTAARNPSKELLKSIILIGAFALIMLTFININTDFPSFSEKIKSNLFHIESGILFLYWGWLLFWYNKLKQNL